MSRLFIVNFDGHVIPSDVSPQDCPFKQEDFDDPQDWEKVRSLEPGDLFNFVETKFLKADDLDAAIKLADAMVREWHSCHWSDCKWTIGEIAEVTTLEDMTRFMIVANSP